MRDSQGVGREEMNREREGEPRERRQEKVRKAWEANIIAAKTRGGSVCWARGRCQLPLSAQHATILQFSQQPYKLDVAISPILQRRLRFREWRGLVKGSIKINKQGSTLRFAHCPGVMGERVTEEDSRYRVRGEGVRRPGESERSSRRGARADAHVAGCSGRHGTLHRRDQCAHRPSVPQWRTAPSRSSAEDCWRVPRGCPGSPSAHSRPESGPERHSPTTQTKSGSPDPLPPAASGGAWKATRWRQPSEAGSEPRTRPEFWAQVPRPMK